MVLKDMARDGLSPPNFNIVTRNAIVASDVYLVPAKPDYLSTLGITELEKHISTLIEDYNSYVKSDDSKWNKISPRLLGIVFTMVTFYGGIPVRALREFIAQVGRENIPIFKNYIRENKTAFADALDFGVPVVIKTLSGVNKSYRYSYGWTIMHVGCTRSV